MRATIVPRAEMVRNWQRVAPPPDPVSGPSPRALNLDTVLDLGNIVFFTFRGRAYGIPPLAWRDGERLLDCWLEAQEIGMQLERNTLRQYYRCIANLQRLLWKNTRPTGPFRRLLRFLHLHRNPFRDATEGELAELAVFLLGRRTNAASRLPLAEAREPETF